ncbi:MAG: hydrolase [Gemmatimonadota bacterium]|jgi:predicted alpha/beta-fold hydrolase
MAHEKRRALPETGSFEPAWWLPGAHAQTIAGRLLRRTAPPTLHRERIDLPDGDFLDLDITQGAAPGSPLVLLLHGLEGSSRRGYALNVYRELGALGIGAVGMNFRGCSGEPNRTARSYHSGETEDLRHVLALLRERFPTSALGVIGFSLGGNVLLKYLGEEGEGATAGIRTCVAVSVPFDLGACADSLERTRMGRFYTRRFLATLKEKTAARRALVGDRLDMERALRSRTFREFDDAVTAPLHGFASAEDYYRRCSSAGFIGNIRVPTLLIQAQDDPFLPSGAIPRVAIAGNPRLLGRILARGGHVGFIEGPPWSPRFWVERAAAAHFADHLVT